MTRIHGYCALCRSRCWDGAAASPTIYDPTTRTYRGDVSHLSLSGTCSVETLAGRVVCRTAFDRYRSRCRQFPPDVVERLTGVPEDQVRRAA